MDTIICRGRTDCTAFGVFIAIVFTVIFLNYIQRCIQSHRSNSSNLLPSHNTNNNNNNNSRNPENFPRNASLSSDSPLYIYAINSIPSSAYKLNPEIDSGSESESCAICLGEFEKGENVRVLPKCRHVYHEECIDKWLLRALHCPICRERVLDFQQHHRKNFIANNNVNNNNNNNNTNNNNGGVDVRLNHNNFPPASVVVF